MIGNDQEDERTAADSMVSMRALREIYLYPYVFRDRTTVFPRFSSLISFGSSFMLAHKHAKPWAFMTSYGRVGGIHVSENPAILQDILRNEWGLPDDAIVMSDWSVYTRSLPLPLY